MHVCVHVCVFAKFITEMLIEFSTMSMWVGLMNHIPGCVCVRVFVVSCPALSGDETSVFEPNSQDGGRTRPPRTNFSEM